MRKRAGHKLVLAWIAAAFLFLAANAQAVSLGKIEVASFLGEPLYAEIPLKLDAGESLTKVFVEIASASDYKIFEVYRDRVLKLIRADVASDSRGTRVELSSRASLKSPFFNLVLKIRYGRVTHFKKFPVFLEPPKSIQKTGEKKPLQSVKAIVSSGTSQASVVSKAETAKTKGGTASVFKPYDGWARTGRYGPIVRGDTLSTVAQRLRIDHRYTLNQVMVALFEKNRSKFDQNNMNLLKAGGYLDVPEAAEVERLSKSQALSVLADHEKRWKQLTKQPRYAAEKVAQQTRYSRRVRVGHRADGVASTPSAVQAVKAPVKPETRPATKKSTAVVAETRPKASVSESLPGPAIPEQTRETDILAAKKDTGVDAIQDATEASDSSAMIASLKKENADLQRRLEENEKLLNQKIDSAAQAAKEASRAAIAKLEILVAQLQDKLEEVRKEAQSKQSGSSDWMIWLLSGLIAVLLGIVALLIRREPVHPSVAAESQRIEVPVVIPETRSEPGSEVDEQTDTGTAAPTDADTGREKELFSATIPDLANKLTDADTAETESLKATLSEVPDPNIDYLSEADVYIRYGMEDEALQQVNLALSLQPDNVEAHIKKAEVLRSSNNLKGFEEAVAVADSVLVGAALERFRSAVVDLNDSDAFADDELLDRGSNGISEDLAKQVENNAEAFAALENDDVNVEENKIETDGLDSEIPDVPQAKSSDMSQKFEVSDLGGVGEIDWLQDTPLADDDFSVQPESQAEETMDPDIDDAMQDSSNLLSGFADKEEEIVLDSTVDNFDSSIFEVPVQQSDDRTDATAGLVTDHGDTQKLDNLLSEFSSDDEQDTLDYIELSEDISGNKMEDMLEMDDGEVRQELDHLLSEFSGDDDEVSLGDTVDDPDKSVFGQAEQEADREITVDTDHDAIQELDNLLSKLSDDDEDEKKE
jgi:FimV-like protein